MSFIKRKDCSSTNRAERCRVGDYELVAFDLPAGRAGQRKIGWEVFGPPRRHGDSKTFDDAKAAAEIAFDML
jgi:hypothetical protein